MSYPMVLLVKKDKRRYSNQIYLICLRTQSTQSPASSGMGLLLQDWCQGDEQLLENRRVILKVGG